MRAAADRHRFESSSPGGTRKGALHRLQLAEQMAEMFAVPAATAALLHPVVVWQRQRRLSQYARNRLQPLRTQACRIDRNSGVDQAAFAVIDREHLAGIGPQIVDRGLCAAMAFI